MCPFSERVRIALAAKKIPFQRCDIDLSKKPKWHVEFNEGCVPFLELPNGAMIPDFTVILDFLEEAYPD